MIDAELFATIAPRDYGGFELGLDTYSEIVRRISAASPSTGWVTAFLMGAAWRVLTFPREGQEEIYGGRNYVLGAGAGQPITGGERVEGGYRLNGRTPRKLGAAPAGAFPFNGRRVGGGRAPGTLIFSLTPPPLPLSHNLPLRGVEGNQQ